MGTRALDINSSNVPFIHKGLMIGQFVNFFTEIEDRNGTTSLEVHWVKRNILSQMVQFVELS